MSETVTPTQQVVAANAANRVTDVTSAGGKKLKLRPLSVLEQMKVVRAMGAMHSSNWLYREMVESAFMVVSVNDIPPARPSNEEQIDKLIAKLGDDVMECVMAWRSREIMNAMAAADRALWGSEDQEYGQDQAVGDDVEAVEPSTEPHAD